MDEQKPQQQYLIPAAILLAGVIIAFSIYYSRGGSLLQNLKQAKNPAPPQETGVNASAAAILALKDGDYTLGNLEAAISIVEYGDFQCPFCARFFKTVEPSLVEKYVKTGKAKFVWRDFAFLGEESLWASEAAHCAGDQGKFWSYHNYLFENQKGENQGAFSKDNLKKFAKTLKLDSASFNNCLDSEKYKTKVEDNTKEGRSLGIDGTPTTFVNGQMLVGAQPFSAFEEMLR